ncbi:protein regulator of cytokinesis 1-like [Branchiostoma lanceolatum]|uniref:protein regulator of cytokinesis 1-like n=1 Tax=Branchiostoma lanceolatum TaxID=7740 RepID=UPI00345601EE
MVNELFDECSSEQDLVLKHLDGDVLSSANMFVLKGVCGDVEERYNWAREKAADLRTQLTTLWDRLGIEEAEREAFTRENQGFKLSVVAALQKKVSDLTKLKLQNIHYFVTGLKDEVTKLHCDEEQGEQEARLRGILRSVERWEDLWKKRLALKRRTQSRGHLFKAINELTSVEKMLSKVESEVRNTASSFIVEGCSLDEFFKSLWNVQDNQRAGRGRKRKRSSTDDDEDQAFSRNKVMKSLWHGHPSHMMYSKRRRVLQKEKEEGASFIAAAAKNARKQVINQDLTPDSDSQRDVVLGEEDNLRALQTLPTPTAAAKDLTPDSDSQRDVVLGEEDNLRALQTLPTPTAAAKDLTPDSDSQRDVVLGEEDNLRALQTLPTSTAAAKGPRGMPLRCVGPICR